MLLQNYSYLKTFKLQQSNKIFIVLTGADINDDNMVQRCILLCEILHASVSLLCNVS